ncbi:MAG: ABC transporter ATP-binding protein [Acidimicrobiia bacterium]|nr:ABC transporter ATP-binding protein [Acidimicrobiia bacterium]
MEAVFTRGLRTVWRHVRDEPVTFTLALIGASIHAAGVVATAWAIGRVTDELILPAFTTEPATARAALGGALLLVGLGVLRASSILLRRYSAGVTSFRVRARLRRQVGHTLVHAPLEYHRDTPAGQLLAHADADVQASTEVLDPVPFSIGVVLLIGFSLASLLAVDPVLTAVALVLFPALAVLNRIYTDRVHGPVAEVQERIGRVSRIAHESFDGALVVKTLGLADHERDRMATAADSLREARVRVGRIRGTFEPAIDALPNLGIIVLALVGAWRIDSGAIEIGQLVQAMALFGLLAFPVRIVGFFLQELPRSVVATERLDRVFAVPPGPPEGVGVGLPDGPVGLRFDDVAFSWPDGTAVLAGATFEVAPGEIVALVGATGAGKTTLCELVVRLLDPDRGTVSIAGVDVADLDPAALREAVALVFQETFLFADPLRTNIDLNDTVDLQAVQAAARTAHAAGFIEAVTDGYDALVGERGLTLSGGQRQRVALARALVRQPRLLLLDDATSAVDPVVEAAILADLRRELAATTLVVAHRLSTIRLADRVLFLDGGRIAASGRHEELLALPAYERIVAAYERDGLPSGEARP